MAKRIVAVTSLTPTATADTTNLANFTFMTVLQGGSGTQTLRVVEIYLGGLAGTSAPSIMLSSRDSTVAVNIGLGNCTDAAVDAATAALAAPMLVGNNVSAGTTVAQRSSTLHLHNLSFNAFGGVVRLNWPLDQQATVVGNTASLGELSVSAFTGGTTGLMGFHMIYEPSVGGFLDYLHANQHNDWHEQRQGGRLQNHLRRNAKALCRIKWNDL